ARGWFAPQARGELRFGLGPRGGRLARGLGSDAPRAPRAPRGATRGGVRWPTRSAQLPHAQRYAVPRARRADTLRGARRTVARSAGRLANLARSGRRRAAAPPHRRGRGPLELESPALRQTLRRERRAVSRNAAPWPRGSTLARGALL